MIKLCLLVILTLKNQNHVYRNSFMNTMPEPCQGCFKNALNLSCIDLFVTNSPLSLQHTKAVSDGLPDFQKMVITVIKMSFKRAAKLSPKIVLSSSCKNLFLQCVCY